MTPIFLFFLILLGSVTSELKVGVMHPDIVSIHLPYISNVTIDGQCLPSYECDILNAVCASLQENCTLVFMDEFSDRMDMVASGEVDFSIAFTKVTPENAELVHFVRPYYYYIGANLFVLTGTPEEDHPTWEDVEGQRVCGSEGYYAIEAVKFVYNAETYEIDLADFAAQNITVTEGTILNNCTYTVTDNVNVGPDLVQSVKSKVEFGSPQGIVVAHEKSDTLGANISKALLELMNKGDDSPILDMERRSYGAVGVPSNIKLRDIVQAITEFNGTLPAVVEDAIWDE